MAAVTNAGSAWTTAAGDKTVTATPAALDLIVVVAASSGLSGGTTNISDDNSDGRGTYVKLPFNPAPQGFSTTGVLQIWVRNERILSATSTVFTASQSGSSGGGLVVYRVAGMSIAGIEAVRGLGGQASGAAGTTPGPVLTRRIGPIHPTQAALTENVVINVVANGSNTAGMTPRSSPAYTEAPTPDLGYNSPATGISVTFINSGETAFILTWGGTSASQFASAAIELDTSVPIIDPLGMQELQRDNPYASVMRAANW